MNKSLIFAALLVAPTVFAGPGDSPEWRLNTKSPVPTSLQLMVGVARAASPTDQNWNQQFANLFALVEQDPAKAGLVSILVSQTILPSLNAAHGALVSANIEASRARNTEQVAILSQKIDKVAEGISLLNQLLAQTEQPTATQPALIKPVAQKPADQQ